MNEDKINLLKIIDQITYLLELKGENVFKINAFRKAYTIISGISDDLSEMFDSGRLAAVPGIGRGILSIVADYFNMGYSSALRELEAEIPKGLIEINQIRGLGPKKAVQLY
ncbi:MAG: DNA polymerase/3'-5' exonuclease PolX, partial [Chlorobiota bacterium]